MQSKPLAAFVLLGLATSLVAQQQHPISLIFPDEGDRVVWLGTGLPDHAPGIEALVVHNANTSLPIGAAKPTDSVFVWDRKSGNLASVTLKEAEAQGTWTPKASDYHDIAQVKVHVERAGSPVSTALVTLQDPRRKQQQLVDSSSQGDAVFFAVKPGPLQATVTYKSKGLQAPPITQLLDAPLGRADSVPTLTISLPGAPDPGAANTSSQSASDATSSTPPTPGGSKRTEQQVHVNPVGSILGYLFGLAVAVALGYMIVRYFQQNNDSVAAKLEQLGVQIPKPGVDPLTDPANLSAPVPAPKPAPPQKIILGDASPGPLTTSSVAYHPDPVAIPMPLAPMMSGPHLVSADGDAIPLPEGEIVVGREPGLGLSLVGESTVSRHHAQLVRNGSEVSLRDLGSTNGTFINGAQVAQSSILRPGDQVQFGAVKFRYEA